MTCNLSGIDFLMIPVHVRRSYFCTCNLASGVSIFLHENEFVVLYTKRLQRFINIIFFKLYKQAFLVTTQINITKVNASTTLQVNASTVRLV